MTLLFASVETVEQRSIGILGYTFFAFHDNICLCPPAQYRADRVVPWDSAPVFLMFECLGEWDFGHSGFLGYLAGWDFEGTSSSFEFGWWTKFQLDSSRTFISESLIFVPRSSFSSVSIDYERGATTQRRRRD
jgi:hypothetical protein